ncbi:hypothetical protein CN495_08870 [Bacillus thuringiensis]|uniref:Phage protein n=1 Tax=Bacillus thuringiensis TaxID=1428 RepID=A0ABD6S7N8_BACTU|nr:hypothetical protein [Bacillus thuringiensis]KLA04834.1 hypothetical protein B4086_5792 [Bacillus cereus]PER55853.1 hypothetical protein CN495_08870 [Bacillus thuringiensis]
MEYKQTGESLGEFRTNKEHEFVVSGEVVFGNMFDEMTVNVFKLQENGGRGELVEQHTRRYPVVQFGKESVGVKLVRKFRSRMLEKTFSDFEETNEHGILFAMQ